MDPYDWLSKFYNFYMVAVVDIISRHHLIIEAYHRNQLNKTKLAINKLLFSL